METPDALRGVETVILAGGRGTRLAPLPGDVPKPLRPVAGRPFLARLLDQVRAHGGSRIVLSLGYRWKEFLPFVEEQVRSGLDVVARPEPEPLGTGGGLRNALPCLSGAVVLVLNGDSFAGADFGALLELHRSRGAEVTLLLRRVPDVSRYGRAELGGNGLVTAFTEKGAPGPGLVNAGVYAMSRAAVASIPEGRPVSLERDVFPPLAGRSLFGLAGDFPFIDIGTPETYREAEAFFSERGRP